MSEERNSSETRRRVLKLIGTGTVLVPIIGLAGCSGEKQAPAVAPKADSMPPKAADKATGTVDQAETPVQPAPANGMAKLSEDDQQAKSLSYVHDATQIDSAKQPRYRSGQACHNCALFQAASGDEWGNCSIFPGRQVAAAGWCSVYAPKVG